MEFWSFLVFLRILVNALDHCNVSLLMTLFSQTCGHIRQFEYSGAHFLDETNDHLFPINLWQGEVVRVYAF